MAALASTSAFDQTRDRSFAVHAGRDADLDELFRRAMRHSRRVHMLRKAIPVIVGVLVIGTAMIRWLDPLRVLTRLPASAQGVVISGTKVTMAAPKLSGYTNDGRRYEMNAKAATQDLTKPNVIELNDVHAKIEATDKSTMDVGALGGLFDRSSGILTLKQDVKLVSSSGLEVRLEEAVIDTGTNEIISEKPVEVLTGQGTIKANRLEVVNGGEVINFIGAVNVLLPGDNRTTQQTSKP